MRIPTSVWAIIGATATAIAAIGLHEGYRETTYLDDRGIPTIGFGTTTTRTDTAVQPNQRISPVEALRTLQFHADRTAKALAACIGDVPLTKEEWDAYVSWAYNVGPTAACRSTLVKYLKATPPKYKEACDELLRWTKVNGKEHPGLKARRQREWQQCSRHFSDSTPS